MSFQQVTFLRILSKLNALKRDGWIIRRFTQASDAGIFQVQKFHKLPSRWSSSRHKSERTLNATVKPFIYSHLVDKIIVITCGSGINSPLNRIRCLLIQSEVLRIERCQSIGKAMALLNLVEVIQSDQSYAIVSRVDKDSKTIH